MWYFFKTHLKEYYCPRSQTRYEPRVDEFAGLVSIDFFKKKLSFAAIISKYFWYLERVDETTNPSRIKFNLPLTCLYVMTDLYVMNV